MSAQAVLVPLAPGFEEIEAVTLIDVLRRGGLDVTVAGLENAPIQGAHGITVVPDLPLSEVKAADFEMIVLPGGLPGAANLRDDPLVQKTLRAMGEAGKYTCAICAAPIALMSSGVGKGHTLTSYPGFEKDLDGAADVRSDRVVIDRKVVTSRGPGTAIEFALTLVGLLVSEEKVAQLQDELIFERAAPAHRA